MIGHLLEALYDIDLNVSEPSLIALSQILAVGSFIVLLVYGEVLLCGIMRKQLEHH